MADLSTVLAFAIFFLGLYLVWRIFKFIGDLTVQGFGLFLKGVLKTILQVIGFIFSLPGQIWKRLSRNRKRAKRHRNAH